MRDKISCIGLTRAAKAEQKSLVPARQAQRTNQERTPFICNHSPQFQQSAGATPFYCSLSGTLLALRHSVFQVEPLPITQELAGGMYSNNRKVWFSLLILFREVP